jgi:hypothetical protein
VEAVKPNASLEKLRLLSKGKSLKVAKLPPLGSSNEGTTTAYFHKTNATIYTCPNPLNLQVMLGMKGGMAITSQEQKRTIWIEASHHDESYVGR